MRLLIVVFLVLGAFLPFVSAQNQTIIPSAVHKAIDKEACWVPREGGLGKIRDLCSSRQGSSLGECFAVGMEAEGANPKAIAFTNRLGNLAYMSRLLETGRVDVAYIEHPFRANENYSWFFVNGVPDLIDVDDPIYRTKTTMEKDSRYTSLKKTRPQLALWSDDRTSNRTPMMKGLRGQGQRFVVSYRVTNGCRACEYLGTAWFAFDFEESGKFMGTKFLGIEKNPRQSTAMNQSSSVEQGFTNPKKPIEAKAGQKFTIVLGANHTTGYRWELANDGEKNIVELVGSEYKVTDDGKIGSGGREVWTFLAKSRGKTNISFRYARPWEKEAGAKTTSFEILVQ